MRMMLILLWGLVGTLTACGVFGQAKFVFFNCWLSGSEGKCYPVYDWLGNPLEGSNWRAELYGGPSPDSLSPAWGSEDERVLAMFKSGVFAHPTKYAVLVHADGRGWAWLQVKVWDIRLGTTFEEAVAKGCGGYGQSELFYAQGTLWFDLYPARPIVGFKSFSVLEPVPEADVGVLVAVGAVALWWWRSGVTLGHPLEVPSRHKISTHTDKSDSFV